MFLKNMRYNSGKLTPAKKAGIWLPVCKYHAIA